MPLKFRVRISETAENDFVEAWRFISEDSPEAAFDFLLQLEKQVSTLETFPARCPLISENDLIGTQYRHLIHGDYRVIFRIEARVVYVVRIIHAARLLDAAALQGE
jgi:toxin ParE1/3/4